MTDFSKFSKEDSREILDSCFKSANKLPQINTLEDWIHAFLTMLEAECWSKALDNKEKRDIIEKKSKATEDGCVCKSQALDVAARARILREGRFYNYIKDVLECHDVDKLAILSVKHKSLLLTKDEYKDLGLDGRTEITKKDTDAIYRWKYAKDGQYEKEKVAKCVAVLKDLGFSL